MCKVEVVLLGTKMCCMVLGASVGHHHIFYGTTIVHLPCTPNCSKLVVIQDVAGKTVKL
jgi:hypothetical protein